ncbi:MAG: cysteine synthase family protein [Steroidobacteraceae bacterium]
MSSVLEAIGDTPLIELARITGSLPGRILLKLEYLNPGLSKKDRAALGIIEEAERTKVLRSGQTVVELTSGNMGTGLAIVCAVKGYPFVAVISRGNSPERVQMMRALGAEVVLVDQAPRSPPGQVSGNDLQLVDARAREITQERGAFRADQFVRDGNWRAHHATTGPEILRQAGHVDAFCDFVGSGGAFRGCAQALREANPATRCYVVEPAGAAALAGQEVVRPNHRIQGGGYAIRDLRFLEDTAVDDYLQVTDDEAIACARRLAAEEGIFAGFSTGANLAAALRLLRGAHRGQTVVTLACDSGLKYLSTDLWRVGTRGPSK